MTGTVVRLDCFGFSLTLALAEPAAAEAMRRHFPGFVQVEGDAPTDTEVDATLDADQLAGIADHEQNVLHLVGALLAPRFLLLHASLVVRPDGEGCVAFAGRTGSGKTTSALVAERLGCARLGDDLCLLDWQTGDIAAVPGETHRRPWTDDLLAGWAADATASAARSADATRLRPLRRLVIFDEQSASLTDALMHCTFGVTPATSPDHLRRLASVTQRCEVRRVPPLDWRGQRPEDARALLVREVSGWLGTTPLPPPGDIRDLQESDEPDDGSGSDSPTAGRRVLVGVCDGISMQPAIRRGERVLLLATDARPSVGDVVVFREADDAGGRLVMHRVLAVDGDGDRQTIVTRGDHVPRAERATRDQLVGVVLRVHRDGRWVPVPPAAGWWRRLRVWLREGLRRVPGLRWLVRSWRRR